MSKAELIHELESLSGSSMEQDEELNRTIQNLETHQAELEMQNHELQHAQRLIETSRDRYSMLFDYAPTGYVLLDASGTITSLNFTASELLGVDRRQAVHFPFCMFVARDHASDFWDHIRRCRRGDSRIVTDLHIQPRSASQPRPVQLVSVPSHEIESEAMVFWTVIIDLSDRERLEAERASRIREQVQRTEAERANQAKDEFLATLSHELRTPLNVISGWVQLLQMGNLPPSEKSRGYDVIQKSVRQQVQIINDLLDMSRIIRGVLHLDTAAVEIRAVLQDTVASVRPAAEQKSVSLHLTLPPFPLMVRGDLSRLTQIFSNLVQNAVKFTPAGGKVDVVLELGQAALDDGHPWEGARIAVRDTGVGIRPEFLPHVFERFRQEDSSTTRRHGGLGLGLAIVRHLVDTHGGKVTADSKGEGLGSTFTVELPLAETGSVEPAAVRNSCETSLEGLAVLLVDDDALTRDMLQRALEPMGAELRAAGSATEAFDTLRQWTPSIIVCDIGMPDEDGLSLIRRLREMPREAGGNLPAVALTAYVGNVERDRALDAGFDTFLTKPIDPRDLAAEITRVVERSRP